MSFLYSNSLFSAIITLYIIIFLYFPFIFFQFILSPVVVSTIILLLYLLRLGAEQNSTNKSPKQAQIEDFHDRDHECVAETEFELKSSCETEFELKSSCETDSKHNTTPFSCSFVAWNVRAPLEVIYEEHDENDGFSEENRESQISIIQKYASLSMFYPESDSEASSDEDFPENGDWRSPEHMCYRWEEEDDRDGLIEIELEEKRNNSEADEENLIEIDLFPAR